MHTFVAVCKRILEPGSRPMCLVNNAVIEYVDCLSPLGDVRSQNHNGSTCIAKRCDQFIGQSVKRGTLCTR